MSGTTPSGITYPTLTDAPNINEIQTTAVSIDPLVIGRFASAAARTAAITSPVDGQLTYRTDLKVYQQYSAATTSWVLHTTGSSLSSTGTLITGTFDASKPVVRAYKRVTQTTDSNALYTWNPGVTMSALLWADGKPNSATTTARALLIREDLCTSTLVVWQLRDLTNNAALLASTGATATLRIEYQI